MIYYHCWFQFSFAVEWSRACVLSGWIGILAHILQYSYVEILLCPGNTTANCSCLMTRNASVRRNLRRVAKWVLIHLFSQGNIHVYTCHCVYIDGLVQERRHSSALAMELCISCTNPSICIWVWLYRGTFFHILLLKHLVFYNKCFILLCSMDAIRTLFDCWLPI